MILDTSRLGRRLAAIQLGSKGRDVNLHNMVADLDEMLGSMTRAHVTLVLPMEEKLYLVNNGDCGQRQCVVADPDGYQLRFCQDVKTRKRT